jgi:hypothetical protein
MHAPLYVPTPIDTEHRFYVFRTGSSLDTLGRARDLDFGSGLGLRAQDFGLKLYRAWVLIW